MAVAVLNPITANLGSPTDSAWNNYDPTGLANWPSDGSGIMGVLINTSGSDITVGFQHGDSSRDRTFTLLAGFGVGFACGINASDNVQFFCSAFASLDIIITCFNGDETTYLTDDEDYSTGTTGSYQDVDVTSDVSASATHALFLFHPASDSTLSFGLRDGDGTTDISDNVGRGGLAVASLDADKEAQQEIGDVDANLYLIGYIDKEAVVDSTDPTDNSVTTGAWTTRLIHADSIVVFLETEKAGGGGDDFSFRSDDGNTEIGTFEVSKSWLPLPCNASGEIDIQGGSANVNTFWNSYLEEDGGDPPSGDIVLFRRRMEN